MRLKEITLLTYFINHLTTSFMKKLLLSLVAVFSFAGAFAYELGDYIYTSDAKYKVTDNNMVDPITSWNGADDVDTWSTAEAEEGITAALQSLDGSEGSVLLRTSTALVSGTRYVVTLKIKGVADGSTSITAGAQNEVNAFITNGAPSADGILTGTSGVDYFMVANSQNFLNGEWSEISFAFVDTCTEATIGADTHYLNITIGRLTTGTVIADAEVRPVDQVYDTRISDRTVDFARAIMADKNFNDGADSGELIEIIGTYEEMKDAGAADDIATMEGLMSQLNEALQSYMNTNSSDLSSNFTNIGITGIGKYNRGSIANEQVIGGFKFRGDNWLHGEGSAELNKQIQGTYGNSAGSVALYNENLPAGKYYIAGELVNSLCDKNYNYTYTLEKNIKLFVGSDSTDAQTISGRDFVKFYYIGELKEGEKFEAGFWWEGHDAGSSFKVKNVEVRGFGDITAKIERNNAWSTFIAQWKEAVKARNSITSMQGNADFPWEQDSLTRALEKWDYLYNKVNGVWVEADGDDYKDLGVATNDELTEWATTQGYEYKEGVDPEWMSKYPLVRAYQYASSFVQEQNKPYTDLKALVAEAKAAVADPYYAKVDATDLNGAITEAESLINGATAENQSEEFAAQTTTLKEVLSEFYMNGASFNRPAKLAVINPNFTYKKENITGGESKKDASGGWDSYTTNGSEYWRLNNNDAAYVGGGVAAMWRGWTGNPRGSLTQDITVTRAGHYTFKCQAYCTVDGGGQSKAAEIFNNNVRKINIYTETQQVWDEELEDYVEEEVEIGRDTTYQSGIYLVFGSVTNQEVDSIDVWTSGDMGGNAHVAVWTPQWFELEYDKATDGEETLRFGMDGLKPAGELGMTYKPNAYGFGSVTVTYAGPSEQYYKDKEEYIATGVEPIVVNKGAKAVAIFTLSGARVNSYVKGINIVKYDDGTVRKIYVK